jgi:hypothetical protein
MATRRDERYIWVTWLKGVLAADAHCEWALWFKAHYTFDKRPTDFNLASWTAAHGEMVRSRVADLRGNGWTVYVENQNAFSLKGKAATLGGKPDIVAVRDREALVVDCKTGQRRDSDFFQVLLYLMALPRCHHACKERVLAGELQYSDGSVQIPATALKEELRVLIRRTIERAGALEATPKTPSFAECQYCDIGAADCPERIEKAPGGTVAAEDLF